MRCFTDRPDILTVGTTKLATGIGIEPIALGFGGSIANLGTCPAVVGTAGLEPTTFAFRAHCTVIVLHPFVNGPARGIRTPKFQFLRLLPKPFGYRRIFNYGAGHRIRTCNRPILSRMRLPVTPRPHGGHSGNRTLTIALQVQCAPVITKRPKIYWLGRWDSNPREYLASKARSQNQPSSLPNKGLLPVLIEW